MLHCTKTDPTGDAKAFYNILCASESWEAAVTKAREANLFVPDPATLFWACCSLISTINATGGLADGTDGGVHADPEWVDLADAYVEACDAVGVVPLPSTDALTS